MNVINALNRYFVPVYVSHQDPGPAGPVTAAQAAEVHRIYVDFIRKKLGSGTVHVYILKPDGSSFRGMDIGPAVQPGKLEAFLTGIAQELGTTAGPPVVKPHPQSVPGPHGPNDLVFHLVARGGSHNSWGHFPSENWIVLSRQEWMSLLPRGAVAVGASWEVDPAVAHKLLTRFYPQTEEVNNKDRNRIDLASLRMTVVKSANGVTRARIEGNLRMKHSFYPGKDQENDVQATLTGFMDFEPATHRIQRLRLVTQKATYMNDEFSAALTSVSSETLSALAQ
ncbi:MAG TPA: hypothetical protein VG675_01495 [Bryobacteraceae bacterium]|nr:hypothetical protein [Bryobacteraceae bacterium]